MGLRQADDDIVAPAGRIHVTGKQGLVQQQASGRCCRFAQPSVRLGVARVCVVAFYLHLAGATLGTSPPGPLVGSLHVTQCPWRSGHSRWLNLSHEGSAQPRRPAACHAIPCHAIPCYAMPCHPVLCHPMPCHLICHPMSCRAVPTMPSHAIPYHAIPCYAIPCHAM